MDFCQNVTVSGDYHQQEQVFAAPPPCSMLAGATLTTAASTLDDLFPAQNTEVDVSLEWLSVFVEDCLYSTGNCLPLSSPNVQNPKNPGPEPLKPILQQQQAQLENSAPLQKFSVPGKARSKRKRVVNAKTRNPLTSWSYNSHQTLLHLSSSDPPLLQQTHWLADSELITPPKHEVEAKLEREMDAKEEDQEKGTGHSNKESVQQPRRCTHCLSQRTPQWRAGPLGPKTLCNACGVRYKSGRLLPEYRPAKSPTFVSYLHSNSHKKVMEMRMAGSTVSH